MKAPLDTITSAIREVRKDLAKDYFDAGAQWALSLVVDKLALSFSANDLSFDERAFRDSCNLEDLSTWPAPPKSVHPSGPLVKGGV